MKHTVVSSILLLAICALMSGCIKNTPYTTTINPYLTASIGAYNYTASSVVPSTIDTQAHDTAKILIITGKTSDLITPYDKIVLAVNNYKGLSGTFSIVQNQAGAIYYHTGVVSHAIGGIVAITRITKNSIIGYFSFTTADGISVTNGAFNVGLP